MELTERLAHWLDRSGSVDPSAGHEEAARSKLKVVDLGSGTGSNLRYLTPRIPGSQEWVLVDHDAALLDRVTEPGGDCTASTMVLDLADATSSELAATIGDADLVTASALLDLVSSDWLNGIATLCERAQCAALFVLTYDGTIAWSGEPHPYDELVRSAVNTHQRGEKGLGSALGPDAASAAEDSFQRRGFGTFVAPSPWRLGSEEAELARALVDGWEGAAVEIRPDEEAGIRAWADERRESLGREGWGLTVGHIDVLALPAAAGSNG